MMVRSVMRAVLLLGLAAPCAALAQGFPNRTIQMINPFSAGGTPDILGRALAEGMAPVLGQQVIVINREGAGGVIGGTQVASAAPDGYTLGYSAAGTITTRPLVVKNISYSGESFDPICQTFELHIVLAVHVDSPLKTFADFVAAAKKAPEAVSVGHSGAGSPPHLAMAHLESVAGFKANHIAYRGDGQLLPNLEGKHVDVAAAGLGAISGRPAIRALAFFGAKRVPTHPDLPTVIESGYPVERVAMGGLFGPKGLPADVKAKLETACAEGVKSEPYRATSAKLNQPVEYLPGAAWDRRLKAETKLNAELIKRLGIQPE